MPILKSTSALWHPRLLSFEEIQKAWDSKPSRLINFLGMKKDRSGKGICCPFCNSGSGDHGTGMRYYHAPNTKYRRLKCFASKCEVNMSPFDLVMRLHPDAYDFQSAMDLLSDLYAPATSKFDDEVESCICGSGKPKQRVIQASVLPTYRTSIEGRQACPKWQQRLAEALGLPVSVFDRPDIGKSFWVKPDGSCDVLIDTCGDMVTYNLVDGVPCSVKVRHTPGLNTYGFIHWYTEYNGHFFPHTLHRTNPHHEFRMSGPSGYVCFGHDYIHDAELVVIVEGQSDVLATVAAFQACGKHSYTAIGRDSSGHVLKDIDLSVLAGKRVIYASDFDTIGSDIDQQNYALLAEAQCSVQCWSAPAADAKDPRAVYINAGPGELVNSLLSSPSLSSFN